MLVNVFYFGRMPRTNSLRSSCPVVGKRVTLELECMFLVTVLPSTMNYNRIMVFGNFKSYIYGLSPSLIPLGDF